MLRVTDVLGPSTGRPQWVYGDVKKRGSNGTIVVVRDVKGLGGEATGVNMPN